MSKLNRLIVPYSVPNVIVERKIDGEKIKFYAVSSDGERVILGPVENKSNKDWMKYCWDLTKADFLENYYLI